MKQFQDQLIIDGLTENATIVVEQERATAKRLLCEMEELRSNIQLQVPNLPISDEVKEARLKLYAAEQQLETLRTEIRDLQDNLMEEKRKSRIVCFTRRRPPFAELYACKVRTSNTL